MLDVKVGSVQQGECDLNYNSAALCSDTRGRQLTSKLIGVLQIHQSSFPTWLRSALIGQFGTRFEAKGATRAGGARGCRSRNLEGMCRVQACVRGDSVVKSRI